MDETLHVKPWPDPAVDTLGHDPRSWYAETFWLPTLGPTSILLLRRFADGFDRNPEGFVVTSTALSTALGLGDKATTGGPLRRSLRRLVQFGLAADEPTVGDDTTPDVSSALLVRRHLPAIHRKHIHRLPIEVRALHHDLAEAELTRPLTEIAVTRARRTALCLLSEGESPDTTERALLRIGYPATITRNAVSWATHHNIGMVHEINPRLAPPPPSETTRTSSPLVAP